MLNITQSCKNRLAEFALCAYPLECCGFVFGSETNNVFHITKTVPCNNFAKDKSDAYKISATDYMQAEKYADENKMSLLGVYHSHPNCAATPSKSDAASAFPNFLYLIISVSELRITDLRSWKLNDQYQFEEEIIINKKSFSNKEILHGNHNYTYALT